MDTTLPFFAYGFLRPGEIAYPQIGEFVQSILPAEVSGRFWLRDGLLLFDTSGNSFVAGSLLSFFADQAETAYQKINEFEPDKLYKWDTVEVSVEGSNRLESQGAEG